MKRSVLFQTLTSWKFGTCIENMKYWIFLDLTIFVEYAKTFETFREISLKDKVNLITCSTVTVIGNSKSNGKIFWALSHSLPHVPHPIQYLSILKPHSIQCKFKKFAVFGSNHRGDPYVFAPPQTSTPKLHSPSGGTHPQTPPHAHLCCYISYCTVRTKQGFLVRTYPASQHGLHCGPSRLGFCKQG